MRKKSVKSSSKLRRIKGSFKAAIKRPSSVMDYLNLAPIAACAVSCLFALIQLIRFIVGNGFKTQVDLIKELGVFGALDEIFTTGTVPAYYNAIFCIAMGVLLIIGIVLALIEFFRKEKVWRKVLATILFVLGIALFVLAPINDSLHLISEPFRDFDTVMFLAGIVFLVGSIALLVTAPHAGDICIYAFGSVLIVFGILPLILLLIENIIGLVILAVTVGALLIFGSFAAGAAGGEASGDGSTAPSGSSDSGSGREKSKTRQVSPLEIAKNSGTVQKDNNVAYVRLSSNYKVIVRDDRVYGLNVEAGSTYFLCWEKAVKNGTYKIVDANTGREIPLSQMEHR